MDVLLYAGKLLGVVGGLVGLMFGMGALAAWLHKTERTRALREANRTRYVPPQQSEIVRCVHGQHGISRRRAINDGFTYDGQEVFICHRHLFERKRQLRDGVA